MKRFIELIAKVNGRNEILSFGLYNTHSEVDQKIAKLFKDEKIEPISKTERTRRKIVLLD